MISEAQFSISECKDNLIVGFRSLLSEFIPMLVYELC